MASANVVSRTLSYPPLQSGARRLSPATLETIKAIPLIDIVEPYAPLRRAGQRFKGLCPFHQEKTPSFFVDPNKQSFRCYGCDAGGDAIAFVMRLEGCDFRQAVNLLAARAGIAIEGVRVDHRKLTALSELKSIEVQIKRHLVRQIIWWSNELDRLRWFQKTRNLESMPADIYDRLRHADACYVFIALMTEADAVEFLCSSAIKQQQRIDEALEVGFVRNGKFYWEVPLNV